MTVILLILIAWVLVVPVVVVATTLTLPYIARMRAARAAKDADRVPMDFGRTDRVGGLVS